jgi:protein involved in polysaccharide export with SLBB domain
MWKSLTVFLLFASTAWAQPTTNPAGTVEAGDLVEISMFDLNSAGGEAVFRIRIDADGRVAVPWVAAITVGGKTTDVAAAAIGDAYRNSNLLLKPQVTLALVTKARNSVVQPGPMGVGDTLKISVLDPATPALPRWSHINAVLAADGSVTIPVVGQVKVVGLTEGEAAGVIAKAYEENNVMKQPMVIVLRTLAAGK